MSERFILIGYPLGHSVSPALHQAAYQELGLPHRYELVEVPHAADVRGAVAEVRAGKVRGANVTIPHKKLALELADAAEPLAAQVGAANVLVRRQDGAVVAHNTDVAALAEELLARQPVIRTAAVIGNGGAALAAVAACRAAGAINVVAVARSWQSVDRREAWRDASKFEALGATLMPWPGAEQEQASSEAWQAVVTDCDVLVQATSAGMHGADNGAMVRDIVPWSRVSSECLAYDLVYNPPLTPFLKAAHARGLKAEDGLGMLVGQAALSIELWLGISPPRPAMRQAAEHVLAARAEGT